MPTMSPVETCHKKLPRCSFPFCHHCQPIPHLLLSISLEVTVQSLSYHQNEYLMRWATRFSHRFFSSSKDEEEMQLCSAEEWTYPKKPKSATVAPSSANAMDPPPLPRAIHLLVRAIHQIQWDKGFIYVLGQTLALMDVFVLKKRWTHAAHAKRVFMLAA